MNYKKLKPVLDELAGTPDLNRLSPDPVEVVHEYSRSADIEVAGFIASALAYGNVHQIVRSVRKALAPLGDSPAQVLMGLTPAKALKVCEGFRHRFHADLDLAYLLMKMRVVLKKYGSLENAFLLSYSPEDASIREGLIGLVDILKNVRIPYYDRIIQERNYPLRVDHFTPSPEQGSACKRLNLFLRWMVRADDGVDFGVWERVSSSKLIVPLDTHVLRISQYIGLTKRNAGDWKTASEITEGLRQLDPADPIRYDFAISRLGILRLCNRDDKKKPCDECVLKGVCVHGQKG